jgi:TetR/AcrR family transcriptional regulator
MTSRARSDAAKAARRQQIVLAAQGAFDAGETDSFTMDDVAVKVGLSKAALYGYFPTREALLLAVLDDELAGWFDAAHRSLRSAQEPAAVTAALADTLLRRPRMVRLLAVLPSLLERNIPYDTAHAFKERLLGSSASLGAAVDTSLGARAGAGQHLLVQLHAAVVGLYHAAHPAPIIAQVLADRRFAPLRIDLRRELTVFLNALIDSALSPTEEPL